MEHGDRELLSRIESFSIEPLDSELTFSKRLARENGWSHEFALSAIEEYKRFVYLAMIAGHPVTPSVEVDQVWHLHLTYTQSYWEDFCRDTLGRPFHHHPTRGGMVEGKKFDEWYERTLSSYREHFGKEPPKEFWPSSGIRFSRKSLIRQVSDRTHWVIRKPSVALTKISSILILSLLTIGGCATVNQRIVESDYFFLIVFLAILLVVFVVRRGAGGGRGGDGSGCGSWFGGCGGSGCASSGCSGCGGGGCGGCGG